MIDDAVSLTWISRHLLIAHARAYTEANHGLQDCRRSAVIGRPALLLWGDCWRTLPAAAACVRALFTMQCAGVSCRRGNYGGREQSNNKASWVAWYADWVYGSSIKCRWVLRGLIFVELLARVTARNPQLNNTPDKADITWVTNRRMR